MNMGQASHTFAVDVAGKTYVTDLIDPGTTVVLKVPALDAGTYAAYCTVSGHKDLGHARDRHRRSRLPAPRVRPERLRRACRRR